MGIPIHSINMLDGSTRASAYDLARLSAGLVLSVPTTPSANAVVSLPAVTAGTGYTSIPTITPTGGTGSGLTVLIPGLTAGGIQQPIITNSGNYTVVPTGFTITGGGGSGAALGAPTLGTAAGGSVTTSVTFAEGLPSNYFVGLTANIAGDPYVINKTTTGFSIVLGPPLATTILGAALIDVWLVG